MLGRLDANSQALVDVTASEPKEIDEQDNFLVNWEEIQQETFCGKLFVIPNQIYLKFVIDEPNSKLQNT